MGPLQQSSLSTTTTIITKKDKSPRKKISNKKKRDKKDGRKFSNDSNDYIDDDNNYVHPSDYYFDVDHSRIYCDPDTKECIEGTPTLQKAPLSTLQQLFEKGGLTKNQRRVARELYKPYNTITLTTPTFREA